MFHSLMLRRATAAGLMMAAASLATPRPIHAQNNNPNRDPYADRYRSGRYDAYAPVAQVEPGTYITVRTQQPIDTAQRDGRVYTAVVQDDVWDDYKRLAVPMIQQGSPAELLVRQARNGDLRLDLESVTVNGQRYAVSTSPQRVVGTTGGDRGNNAPAYAAGGAIIGTIVGALVGGGKGAAIGAISGAAAGAGASLVTQGHAVRVPGGTTLTFRLDEPLTVGGVDAGYERDGVHYHR